LEDHPSPTSALAFKECTELYSTQEEVVVSSRPLMKRHVVVTRKPLNMENRLSLFKSSGRWLADCALHESCADIRQVTGINLYCLQEKILFFYFNIFVAITIKAVIK
jgi:hypothetical protein